MRWPWRRRRAWPLPGVTLDEIMPRAVVPREGFIGLRCPGCAGTVTAPLGPDFWHPASGGVIRPRRPLRCQCGTVITTVTPGMLPPGGA